MKVQYASDLHLEFPENKKFLTIKPLQPEGDILILAGDVVPFANMAEHNDFFNYLSDHFQTTYWIPGNHEYYHSDIAHKSGTLNEAIKKNVFLVNNTSILYNDIKLIFSTLWSRITAANQWYIERGMSDFHVIKYQGDYFSSIHFNQLHEECLNFLKKELLNQDSKKSIVATHHIPTLFNYPSWYKGNVLNEAFAVELFDLIDSSGPDYWIYGHSHNNTPDFTIRKTQLVTNQLGYVEDGEHTTYCNNSLINF
jgi:predicted phosphohydrolase